MIALELQLIDRTFAAQYIHFNDTHNIIRKLNCNQNWMIIVAYSYTVRVQEYLRDILMW